MIALRILLDGDGVAEDLAAQGMQCVHLGNDARPIRVSYLSGGTKSGLPSVALIIELPGGTHFVLAETTARLFVMAGDAIRQKAAMEGFTI